MTTWTNQITPGSPITAFDVQEVVNAINADRQQASLDPYPWAYPTISTETPVFAVVFTQMRDAIQDLWNNKLIGPLPGWRAYGADGQGPAPGRPIYAQDILDVRYWLDFYELSGDSPPYPYSPSGYGVYSQGYYPDPLADGHPDEVITQAWADDVANLGVKWVRLLINSNPVDNSLGNAGSGPLHYYATVCQYYANVGIKVMGVLTAETDRYPEPPNPPPGRDWPSGAPNDALSADPSNPDVVTNAYITHFAARIGAIVNALGGLVSAFEIWNEPNDPAGEYLASQNFGSLLYYSALQLVPPSYGIVTAGLLYTDDTGYDSTYLKGGGGEVGLYNSTNATYWHANPPQTRTYPWGHIGVHPYWNLQYTGNATSIPQWPGSAYLDQMNEDIHTDTGESDSTRHLGHGVCRAACM